MDGMTKKYENLKFVLHQKKRRLRNLEQKLKKLMQNEENHKIRICFGSKKLFHKQFHLKENDYSNPLSMKQNWLELEVVNSLSLALRMKHLKSIRYL